MVSELAGQEQDDSHELVEHELDDSHDEFEGNVDELERTVFFWF